jgi:hypothetical protein
VRIDKVMPSTDFASSDMNLHPNTSPLDKLDYRCLK